MTNKQLNPAFGLILALIAVVVFAVASFPHIEPGAQLPGGDADEYAHLAQSLLHGSYLVDYDGPPRPTRYTLGFSILLMPAVALGGLEAGVWVAYLSALLLGCLAALLAWRIAGGLAAPLAAALVLFNVGVYVMAHSIMSDLPSVAIAVAELTLIAFAVGPRSAVAAGFLAACLVWIRPGSLVLVLASIAALSATIAWRPRLVAYFAGLVPPLPLLGAWQWVAFGSPFVTSYQAAAAGGGGSSDLSNFFSLRYVFGPPWNTYLVGFEPNAITYALVLMGLQNGHTYPGIGVLGLICAAVLARRSGAAAAVGRFTLAANVLTLFVYVPYFFQDLRFLMLPIALNHVCAAIAIARGLPALRAKLLIGRAHQELLGPGQPGRDRPSSSFGRGT